MASSTLDSPRTISQTADTDHSSSKGKEKDGAREKSPAFLLEKSIRANPNDPFAWHLLGVHCMTKGSIDEAYRCFCRAEQIKAGFSTSNQYYIALCHKEKGNREEAMRMLQSAIALPARNAVDKKGKKLSRILMEELKRDEKSTK